MASVGYAKRADPSRTRGNEGRQSGGSNSVGLVVVGVVLAGAGVVALVATGAIADLESAARSLPPAALAGAAAMLLAVAIPGGWLGSRHLWRGRLARVRERRIRALTPLARLLGCSPLEFGRVQIETLHRLSARDFEKAVGYVLAGHQYRAMEHTGGPADLCADLAGSAPDGKRIVVQCKRYAPDHHVNAREMQQFIGMVAVHHKVPYGLYVTTSSYTPPARDLAHEHADRVRLLDGSQLVAMVRTLAVR